MKAVILNSGMGSRLENLTKDKPKSLVEISKNKTIFSRAISILSKFNIEEFIITTGYLDNILKEYAYKKFPDTHFKFIYNPLYDKTNYIKSIDLISGIDEDIILLHGDLIFTENTANTILNSNKTSVIIDSTIPLPKDDFKAKISNKHVKLISTNYFEDDAVACQPFYKITKEDWKIWKNEIHKFCEKGKTNVYAEDALNTMTEKIKIHPIDIKGELCMEIDTKEDLKKVQEILK